MKRVGRGPEQTIINWKGENVEVSHYAHNSSSADLRLIVEKWKEVDIYDRTTINAQPCRLHGEYTIETEQFLQTEHGINLESVLAQRMSEEIRRDIDTQILDTINNGRSAMDQVNVQRLLDTIRASVKFGTRASAKDCLAPFQGGYNDETIRSQIADAMRFGLAEMQARGALQNFQVICDDTNNSIYTVDRGQLNLDMQIQPIRSIEYINLKTTLDQTGFNFEAV